jgi:hypothetical protein
MEKDLNMVKGRYKSGEKRRGVPKGYEVKRLVHPRVFDPRSFRTIKRGDRYVTIACPKGKYNPRTEKCRIGTRAQRLMRPARKTTERRGQK